MILWALTRISCTLIAHVALQIKVKGMDDSWASPLYQNTPDNWKPVMQWKMKPQNKKKIGKTDHFLSLAYEDFEVRQSDGAHSDQRHGSILLTS